MLIVEQPLGLRLPAQCPQFGRDVQRQQVMLGLQGPGGLKTAQGMVMPVSLPGNASHNQPRVKGVGATRKQGLEQTGRLVKAVQFEQNPRQFHRHRWMFRGQ